MSYFLEVWCISPESSLHSSACIRIKSKPGSQSQIDTELSSGYSTPAVASCSHVVALLETARQGTKMLPLAGELTVMIAVVL